MAGNLLLPIKETETSGDPLIALINTGTGEGGAFAADNGTGVMARSNTGRGVSASSATNEGIFGLSGGDVGVVGKGSKGGVLGESEEGSGVQGKSLGGEAVGILAGRDPTPFNGAVGVYGESVQNGVFGRTASSSPQDHAVYGQNDGAGNGVTGVNTALNSTGILAGSDGNGVTGVNKALNSTGILAGRDPLFDGAVGVYGESVQNGVFGRTASSSLQDHAVYGQNDGAGHGVTGVNTTLNSTGFLAGRDPLFGGAVGVYGESVQNGIFGRTASSTPEDHAVYGQNDGAGHGVTGVNTTLNSTGFLAGRDPNIRAIVGVYGESVQNGVYGRTASDGPEDHAVFGENLGSGYGVAGISHNGIGVFGQGGKFAAQFIGKSQFLGPIDHQGDFSCNGNLHMSSPTSDITLGDVAEGFSTQDGEIIEPGTVVVLDERGLVRPGDEPYDKKVVGVVSGAGDYRPAIVLDKQYSQPSHLPVALMGKVCCKVDAQYSPIRVGDLLTTSPTPGHAMKAVDPIKAFGSVIGKALHPLQAGQGLVPILVALQ